MRIWIINHYAYAPYHSAGTRHYSIASELIRRGHEVRIFSSSFYHKSRKETALGDKQMWKEEVVDGVPFIWVRTPAYADSGVQRLWNMLVFAWRVGRPQILNTQEPPNLVIGSSPDLFAALSSQRIASKYNVPFFFEIRDVWPETLIDLGHFSRVHPLILLLSQIEKYLYRRAAKILTVLPHASNYIATKGGKRENVIWLPNGVYFSDNTEPLALEHRDRQVLMYCGAHGFYNGLDTVLHAARILEEGGWAENFIIRMVGDGPYKAGLKQLASELNLETVIFNDPVPKKRIYEVLQEADAFLMVLREASVFKWGISPNKLFDYLFSARPVIYSVKSSYNPVSDCKAGITVEPNSAGALAEGIKQLLRLPIDRRQKMGLRGYEYVKKHHSIRSIASKLEEVAKNTLAN